MTITGPDALEALKHYNVRVVRAKRVDSPEAAVAFAGRRDAPDAHPVPIALSADGVRIGPFTDADAIARAYRRLAAHEGTHVVAEDHVPSGTDFTVAGTTDASGVKHLALRAGSHGVERMMPLSPDGARTLVDHALAFGHAPHAEHEKRMLAHALVRIASLFAREDVTALTLTLRRHDNACTVISATIGAAAPLHVPRRSARHERDRKGYDYRPTGLQ